MKSYKITFDTEFGENVIIIHSETIASVFEALVGITKALKTEITFITILIQDFT